MCDVDTRALTRHLRERGAMRVGVSSVETDPAPLLDRVQAQPAMSGAHLADEVSTSEPYVVAPDGEPSFRVVAVDLGIKSMTPVRMAERGIEVHVVPSTATFAEIAALDPDGVFFSNGPGDPAAADGPVEVLREVLAAGIPYFGICFGNQLFGRALGFGTYKLGYGHRGINQPVMDLTTRKVEVTAHNHGFAVDAPAGEHDHTPYGTAEVSHVGLNDDVVEGLELKDADGRLLGFSVQYHPEAAAGPHDAGYLFDRFVDLMGSARPAAARPRLDAARGSERSDAAPHRHQLDPGDRLRPDRHRPGLRVRLLGHPGLPGAAGRGLPGDPGQLQPGDDHDRPGVRRRHLHRADHPGVRRAW